MLEQREITSRNRKLQYAPDWLSQSSAPMVVSVATKVLAHFLLSQITLLHLSLSSLVVFCPPWGLNVSSCSEFPKRETLPNTK